MIIITGDVHGEIDIKKLTTKQFPESKFLNKEDYLIICGDVGAIWGNSGTDKYLQKWYQNKPWTTLWIDGNHENFDLIEKYPVKIWNGGKVHLINKSFIHLMRGQVYNINGKNFFTMGGGVSYDKMMRTQGISWWSQEEINFKEMEEAYKNLEKVNFKVDYVISHSAPSDLIPFIGIYKNKDSVCDNLQKIKDKIKFKEWYFGHYHIDEDFDFGEQGIFHALYNRKIKIN